MRKLSAKLDARHLFEIVFWITACMPICFFFANRFTLFSSYIFPLSSPLFGMLGFFIALGLVVLFIFKRPLSSMFPLKYMPYLVSALFLSGAVLGLLFCDRIVMYGQNPVEQYSFSLYMTLVGCGITAFLSIAVASYSLIALILPSRSSAASCYNRQIGPGASGKHTGLILVIVTILCGCTLYWANSRAFYYWDYVIYHELSRDLATIEWPSFGAFLSSIYNSILSWDYNLSGAALPSIFMRICGTSRGVFLLLTTLIYLIPSVFVFYRLSSNWQSDIVGPGRKEILSLAVLLWFPYLAFVTYQGSIDVGGVIMMLGCIYFYFSDDRPYIFCYISCGILLAMLVIFRRWFMFWSVSFCVCAAVDQLIIVLLDKKASRSQQIRQYLIKMGLLFGFFAGFLFLFFQPMLVEKFLLNNVSSAYQAYSGTLGQNFSIMRNYFGILLLALIAIAVVYSFCNRKTLKPALFLCVQTILCFFLFTRIQAHDVHHLLLYVPFMLCILTIALVQLQRGISWNKFRVICGILIAVSSLNLVNTFLSSNKLPLLAEFNMQIPPNANTSEFLSLLYAIDREVEGTGKKALVLSASDDLNTEKLIYAESSFNLSDKKRDYFLNYSIVDTRDGFQESLFEADLIVVPTPVQTYMGESKMRVISVPTQYFYQQKGFAQAFVAGEQYRLNAHTTVTLYHKYREITQQEKESLRQDLASYYPDLPKLFPVQGLLL